MIRIIEAVAKEHQQAMAKIKLQRRQSKRVRARSLNDSALSQRRSSVGSSNKSSDYAPSEDDNIKAQNMSQSHYVPAEVFMIGQGMSD